MKLIVVEAQVLPKHGDGTGKGMEDHGVRAEYLLQLLVVVVELGTHSEAVSHSGKTLVEELCTELLKNWFCLDLLIRMTPPITGYSTMESETVTSYKWGIRFNRIVVGSGRWSCS